MNRIPALALTVILAAGLAAIAGPARGSGDPSIFIEAYGGSLGDFANRVAVTPDGGFVVAGCARQGTGSDFLVAKFAADGQFLWSKREYGYGYGVVAAANGDIYAVGSTLRPAAGGDMVIWKLSSSGQTIWSRKWVNADYDDCLCDVMQATDGAIWAVGTMNPLDNASEGRVVVVRIDPAGSTLWGAYAGHANWKLSGAAITQVFNTDGFCIAGTVETGILNREQDILFAKFSPSPAFLLARAIESDAIGNTYDEVGTDIWRTSDGGLAITGHLEDQYAGRSALLVKLDTNTLLDWGKIASGPFPDLKTLDAVIETASGELITLGNCLGSGVYGVSLAKWTLAGSLIWNRTIHTTAYGQALSLAEKGDSTLVTAGIAAVGAGDDVCLATHNSWGHSCEPEISGPAYGAWSPQAGRIYPGDTATFTGDLVNYNPLVVYDPTNLTTICRADTLHVCPVGGEYTTIQAALSAAATCDIIELCDGFYTGAGNQNLDFAGKNIVLRSASRNPEACVLGVAGNQRGFRFHSNEDPTAVLEGISIANSGLEAILFENAAPVVKNCIIRDCGGINGAVEMTAFSSGVVMEDCDIVNNLGFGLSCTQCGPTIRRCLISGNMASGVSCTAAAPTLTNCTVADNGGNGVECMHSGTILDRCIVAFNAQYGVYCYSEEPPHPGPTLSCCDVWGNEDGDWASCIASQYPGAGNIWLDPLLCRQLNPADPYTISLYSPCADYNNPICGLVGARPPLCDLPGETCTFVSRLVADANIDRTFGTTHEFTLRLRDGAMRPLSYFPPGQSVAFLMDMEGIVYDSGRPGVYYFGEIAFYDPRTGTFMNSVKVPQSGRYNLGLAVQPIGPMDQCVLWTTRAGSAALFATDQDGNSVGSYPAFSDSITGLAFDSAHGHLWCIARDHPDRMAEYDLSSGTPVLIQGPFPVPWLSGFHSGAAGLDYGRVDQFGLIAAVDVATHQKVTFVDADPDYAGPPGGPVPGVYVYQTCFVVDTPDPWGLALQQSEMAAFVATGSSYQPRPIDRYDSSCCPSSGTDDEISSSTSPVRLLQNQPNPFNPMTEIQYEVGGDCHVRLEVYDLRGRRVATLVDAPVAAGLHLVRWDATSLASGVYGYRLTADGRTVTRKAVLLK
jgi:hypothetical protein